MKKLFLTAALILAANVGIAQTQAFKDDVKKIINISGAAGTAQIDMAKKQVLTMIPAEKQEAFLKEFDALIPGFMTTVEQFYLTEFTHDDIKQMIKYYESPVGKKITAKMPLLTEKTMTATQELSGKLQEIIMKYMQ